MRFQFRVREEPSVSGEGEHVINMGCTGLILEGVQRRDTYQAIPESLRAMTASLRRKAEALTWPDAETAGPVKEIWDKIGAARPQQLFSLWRRLNYCALTFLESVQALVDSGQAELEVPLESKKPVEKQVISEVSTPSAS